MGLLNVQKGYMLFETASESDNQQDEYQELHLEHSFNNIIKRRKVHSCTRRETFWRFFFSGCLLAVAGVVWFDRFTNGGAMANTIYDKLSRKWDSPDCGNTPEQARAKGCKFDIMHYAWVPELCFYPMLSEEESMKFTNNSWHEDAAATNKISHDMIVKGEVDTAYNTLEYREYQCAYGWKMLRRALMTRTLVDTRTANLDESAYCANLIFTDLNTSDKPTSSQLVRFELEYLTCQRLSSTRLVATDYHPSG